MKKDKPWTKAQLKLLGNMADGEVAKRTGRTRNAVATKRIRSEIAAYPHTNGYNWERWEVKLLGKMTDQDAADVLGVSRRTVVRERQRRGIAAFGKAV